MKVAFFDTKPYDRVWFDRLKGSMNIKYHEYKLNSDTAALTKDCFAVIPFVNDDVDAETIDRLCENGVKLIAMRSAGYNNVDLKHAKGKIRVVNVPMYSPYAVAEYTMALLLSLNRKIHKAYNRTREHNFSIEGFAGFDLYDKTVGVIGTGKIGQLFIDICRGFKMNVLAYDPYPLKDSDINYVSLEELLKSSQIISLHCPLTSSTHHIINQKSIDMMQDGAIILNTSRGALVNSEDLLDSIKSRKISGVALDVYEEETEFFFEDYSDKIIDDDILTTLISMPNVIVTSHQAFLTEEALKKIAQVTVDNINNFFNDETLENEVSYKKQQ